MNTSGCDAAAFDTALLDSDQLEGDQLEGDQLEGDDRDSARYERAFQEMTGTPAWRQADLEISGVEAQRWDIWRIASTLFCSSDVDKSVISFAKYRIAAHWGLAEEQVDVLVTARLLEKTSSLMADLGRPDLDDQDLESTHPEQRRRLAG